MCKNAKINLNDTMWSLLSYELETLYNYIKTNLWRFLSNHILKMAY